MLRTLIKANNYAYHLTFLKYLLKIERILRADLLSFALTLLLYAGIRICWGSWFTRCSSILLTKKGIIDICLARSLASCIQTRSFPKNLESFSLGFQIKFLGININLYKILLGSIFQIGAAIINRHRPWKEAVRQFLSPHIGVDYFRSRWKHIIWSPSSLFGIGLIPLQKDPVPYQNFCFLINSYRFCDRGGKLNCLLSPTKVYPYERGFSATSSSYVLPMCQGRHVRDAMYLLELAIGKWVKTLPKYWCLSFNHLSLVDRVPERTSIYFQVGILPEHPSIVVV